MSSTTNHGGGFYRAHIRKEALKFSAAHMTVFADGTKERLHGHNYRTKVSLDFEEFSLSTMLPFADVKMVMKEICAGWDEKVLLPELCPHLKIVSRGGAETELILCGKRYVFPSEEVVWLPVDNVTAESLARQFCEHLMLKLAAKLKQHKIRRIEVRVEEMLGQGASYIYES